MRINKVNNKKLSYTYIYNSIMKYIYIVPIINQLILNFNKKRPRISKQVAKQYSKERFDVVPHGSCVIYLFNWVKNESFAFLPYTFMFGEEDILYEYLASKAYKTMYLPSLWVKHLEEQVYRINNEDHSE